MSASMCKTDRLCGRGVRDCPSAAILIFASTVVVSIGPCFNIPGNDYRRSPVPNFMFLCHSKLRECVHTKVQSYVEVSTEANG